jgi:histidine triad (HIT) family protein
MSETAPTLFTRIINREISADIIYEDERCIVIHDIAPQAPIHVLIIPKQPIARLADAAQTDQSILGHLMLVAGDVARRLDVDDAFRLVVNNGADAGQTVFHLHLHILASVKGGKDFFEADTGG